MGRNESGTLAALRTHRLERLEPALSRYGGRLVKLTGDGALAEFSSAVDALGAAIEFQQAMSEANRDQPEDHRIVFRIGLHIGDLIVEGDDLYGDGVNVAARLEAEADAGGIVVSGALHDAVAGRLKTNFVDLGQLTLKNIDRPVRAYRPAWDAADWAIPPDPAAPPPVPAAPVAIPETLALPDKPSLAVLPFQNMSGDPEQQYFADGVVEDITTALSRSGWLFVIARNSSFVYKGKSPDIRVVGRELGVRYVLEGSVRCAGGRVRITCQLIEAATGGYVWADHLDGELTDIFDLQDRITATVVNAIEPTLKRAEITRAIAKPTASLDAYDLYLRALYHHYLFTEAGTREALRFLHLAIAKDSHYGQAKALAAFCVCNAVNQEWIPWGSPEFATGIAFARAALVDSPDDPTALRLAGQTLALIAHDRDAAQSALDRAIVLHTNSAQILGSSGWVRVCQGDFKVACDHFLQAMRLSPLDPELYWFQAGLAVALSFSEPAEPARALDFTRKALVGMPNGRTALTSRICCLVLLGRLDEAAETVQHVLALWPYFTLTAFRRRTPLRPDVAERIIAAMRQAGLPE